jgi:hypothetical protein
VRAAAPIRAPKQTARCTRPSIRARRSRPRRRSLMGGWSRRALLVACAAAALLLLAEPVGGKKAKKRKAGFLSSAEKRAKYADYLFERYDEDSDKALNEEEVDTTNDEEPLFRVHQKYDDTLPTVRWGPATLSQGAAAPDHAIAGAGAGV